MQTRIVLVLQGKVKLNSWFSSYLFETGSHLYEKQLVFVYDWLVELYLSN